MPGTPAELRALEGLRVLVTRPADQGAELIERLARLGAEVLVQPAIQIGPPADWQPVDAALARLEDYDWLVFSSSNGVRFLLDRIQATGGDVQCLQLLRLAAIGPGTAEALRPYRLRAELQPEQFRAEALADALAADAPGKRFLLARASRGREVLADRLRAAGGQVEQVVVYTSCDVQVADERVASRLGAGEIDWITVTSSAIARSLHGLFGAQLRNSRLVSISPVTTETLRSLGLQPEAEASPYTMAGVVEALVRAKQGS